jgi:hypothetical protein
VDIREGVVVNMTQTIQPRSLAYLSETVKTEPEDNMSLFLQVFDSLNNLNETLRRLNYLIQRKNIEQILFQKGETK